MPSVNESIAIAMEQAARGRLSAAIEDLRRLLPLHPSNAELHEAAGLLILRTGAIDQALFHFERAASSGQPRPEYFSNYGTALNIRGRAREAADQFRKAIQVSPRFFAAHLGLSSALVGLNDFAGAVESARAALALAATRPEAWSNLAIALTRAGRSGEAVAALQEALAQPVLRDHPQLVSNLVTALNYRPEADPAQVFEEHKRLGRLIQQGTAAMYPEFPNPDPDRPLRIGYLSGDFRDSPLAPFIAPLLAHHSADFLAYCYSNVPAPDSTTRALQRLCPPARWSDISRLNDDQLEHKIRADAIDILVDLTGYGVGSRLPALARRLAPVQISYLGYPNTTGLKDVTCRIVDSRLAPPADSAEQFSVEKLIRLDPCFACFQPPAANLKPGTPPSASAGHITFGSLCPAANISEPAAEAWARILQAVPNSRLVLKNAAFSSPGVRDHFLSRFAALNITSDRLDLAAPSGADHLAAYQRIDIALDPFPCTSPATTCEALWMGLPVVTLQGKTEAGRLSASVLAAAGLSEFITTSPDDYIALATKLAGDSKRLTTLRSSLRNQLTTSPLCDAKAYIQRLESAYREQWKAWCATR